MSFILSNFLGTTSSTGDSSYSDENKQLIIEKLTTKMTNSAHLEDRKAAAQTIKSLARSHRLEIGTLALQALLEELRRDLEDEELAKIVLETLDILCSSSINESEQSSDGIEVQFCEILLKDEGNVALLLDLMGNSDEFYLRFTSIQILISLCNSQPFQLQTAVLNSPSGVEKVLNLLKDSREIVRNEGLLLCGVLVRGNSDLQKILAFQGAFEQVMQIIVEEEGPWTGPLIIQDAFNLISAMLNLNTSNQNYFRDSICFKQLAGLLSLPQGEDEGLWNSTRISNYLAALSVLDGILCKENVDLEASQNAAMRSHFQGPLLKLAFTPKIPLQVSAAALNCLSGLIWSNNRAQQNFANEKLMKIPVNNFLMRIDTPISPLMASIVLAVHGNPSQEGAEQRAKALELVEAFCSVNFEGQLVLLSTLKASDSASPGTVILEALFDLDSSRKRDPWHCWYASILLCHLIDGNKEAKRVLLKHRVIDFDEEDEGEDLLTNLMLNMIRIGNDSRGSTCQKSIIGYLQLLVVWFHESPMTINAFLSESSFLQYLLERITQQPQELEIQGFASLILGICVLFNDESVERVGSEALKGIIKNRIGPDLFVSRLSRLKSHSDKNDLVCELSKGILLKNYESLMNLVVRPTPLGTKASHTATLAQLTKDLVESRALLTTCHLSLTETTALADKLKIGIAERDAYILQLQKLISEKNKKIAQMAHEMSSHYQQQQQQMVEEPYEKCLADQAALKSLNDTIKSFQETVERQQARIEELEALLRESEVKDGELEKWKEAYHKLYEQVKQQLNCIDGEEVVSEGYDNKNARVYAADGSNVSEDTIEVATIDTSMSQQLSTVSEGGIEVYSPSMFMSPLAESESVLSEPVIVETTENSENSFSPELVTVNQIPDPVAMNEYPILSETIDTSFTAAVIVSEEFANNEPNPSADEIIQNISSECPPDNFLASDPDENVEIVSSEEIKSVLKFFDDLPEDSVESVEVVDSVESSNEVQMIQEGLDHLHFVSEDTQSSPVDQQVPDVIKAYLDDSFELPAEMETDEFDYYAESNFENIPQGEDAAAVVADEVVFENEGHFGYVTEQHKQAEYDNEYIESAEVGDQASHEDQEQVQDYGQQSHDYAQVNSVEYNETQEYSEQQQEHSFDQVNYAEEPHQQDYNYGQQQDYDYNQHQVYTESDQQQQYNEEYYNQNQQPQEQEYTGEQCYENAGEQVQEPVESIDDYFSQEASQEFLQEYAEGPGVEGQEYAAADVTSENYAVDATENHAVDEAEGCNQEQVQEYYAGENAEEYTQEYSADAHSQDYTAERQEEYSQEYTGDGYHQEYAGVGYTQEYTNEGYAQEYAGEGYNQNYNSESYPQEYAVEEYVQEGTTAADVSNQEYVAEVNNQDPVESYSQEYAAQEYTQESTTAEFNQEYSAEGYVQENSAEVYAQEYADETYAQDGPTDVYVQEASVEGYTEDYSASAYSTSEYPNEYADGSFQTADYAENTDQYATATVNEYPQEEYVQDHVTQDQEYAGNQVTTDAVESNEYYYYDEATGYTYGFDQNVNQYYYYDPNTGEYVYYAAPEAETVETTAETVDYLKGEESVASSNPSLFDTAGPPMVSLQQSTPHAESQLHHSFVADPVYNL